MLEVVGRSASKAGLSVWLVGGAVRDLLIGRVPADLDFAVEGPADRLADLLDDLRHRAGWRLVAAHERFGTATLSAPGSRRVDVGLARRETYPRPAALPAVQTGAPVSEDLGRRDFTIHAVARPVAGDGSLGPLLDPRDGRQDLGRRVLRLLYPDSLSDDPTRAFRAVRYAVRLGFGLERGFAEALARARRRGAFAALSGDRLRRALEEVLGEDDFGRAKELLLRLRLLDDICPGWGEGLQREIPSNGGERRGRRDGVAGGGGDSAGRIAGRWHSLLSGLSPSERLLVAERLRFSRALRRAAGVPLK